MAAIVEGSSAVVLKTASGAAAGDFRLENGIEVSALCGSCCLGGRYCGNLSEAVVISDNTGRLANGDIIPAGTRLRCFLEDRSAPGAVDQGEAYWSSLAKWLLPCNFTSSYTSLHKPYEFAAAC